MNDKNLEMSIRAYELSQELRDGIRNIMDTIYHLPELSVDGGQEEVNRHSIVYNLCRVKLQKCKKNIKELRVITIAMGMFSSLQNLDTVERQVFHLEENVNKIIGGLNNINDLTKIINDIKEERET